MIASQLLGSLLGAPRTAVFIDDTGGGSTADLGDYSQLQPDRKSWVAVIIEKTVLPEVLSQMPQALQEIRSEFAASEFHAYEIFQGKGAFKNAPIERLKGIVRFLDFIFRQYKFPVFVQTLDPKNPAFDSIRSQFGSRKDFPFDFSKHEEVALFFLLCRIKDYLLKHNLEPAEICVDEGIRKNGAEIHIPNWRSILAGGSIKFLTSRDCFPLQLADFAAYVLNKQQILINKKSVSDHEIDLIRMVSGINYINLPKVVFEKDWLKGITDRSRLD
jgi:Protein of unknown function (DUF3800)